MQDFLDCLCLPTQNRWDPEFYIISYGIARIFLGQVYSWAAKAAELESNPRLGKCLNTKTTFPV